MTNLKECINVFIIHPGDVVDEIEEVKKICESLNKAIDEQDFIFECKDFNDLIVKRGDFQKRIARELSKADITIGIMKQSVGKQDGFIYEVNLSKSKKAFLMCIKNIEDHLLNDKEKENRALFIDSLQPLQYVRYSDQDLFRDEVRTYLESKIVNKISFKKIKVVTVQEESKNIKNSRNTKVNKTIEAKALIKRTGDLPIILNNVIQDYNKEKGSNLDEYQRIRLFFHSASLLYNTNPASEILGNHEINLLYKYKEKVKPFGNEYKLIFRTIIADASNLRSGWYWLSFIKEINFVIDLSFNFLFKDISNAVRLGCLDMINNFWKDVYTEDLKKLVSDKSADLKNKLIIVLTNHPSKHSLEVIKILEKDSSKAISEKAYKSKLELLTVLNKHEAIRLVIADSKIEEYFIDDILYKSAFENELKLLSKHTNRFIRIKAIEELLEKNTFSLSEVEELLKNSEWSIRYLSTRWLLKKNRPFTLKEITTILKDDSDPMVRRLYRLTSLYEESTLIEDYYSKKEQIEIIDTMEWGYYDGLAYYSWAHKYFSQIKDELYFDLNDNFKTKQEKLLVGMKKRTGLDYKKVLENYEGFIREAFIYSALRVILEHGNKNDIKFGYKFCHLENYRIQKITLDIIAKFGTTKKDGLFLFEAAYEKNNYASRNLLPIALKLSFSEDLVLKIIDSNDKNKISILIAFALRNRIALNKKILQKLLDNSDDEIRKVSLIYLINHSIKKNLEKYLINYYSQESYYYDIVSYLDLYLYAPKKISDSFKKRITKNLINKLS